MAQSKLKRQLIELCDMMLNNTHENLNLNVGLNQITSENAEIQKLVFNRLNTTLHGLIDRTNNEKLSHVCHHNGLLSSIKELGL